MAKERQELEQRVDALTDALTGLLNRRALFEVADALGQDRQLGGAAISVLIFDLDHFKETNDRFGHALGDRVPKLFAHTASTHLNGSSVVARLGGEEFVAILPAPIRWKRLARARPCAVPSPIPRRLSTAWRWVPSARLPSAFPQRRDRIGAVIVDMPMRSRSRLLPTSRKREGSRRQNGLDCDSKILPVSPCVASVTRKLKPSGRMQSHRSSVRRHGS
jgi:GGDEF domain-containing protein